MKIARIDQFFPRRRTRLVKITTDNDLCGWGGTTLEGKPKSTVAAVEELADYLIGKDPLRIEHHWQHIYRSAFYRGGNVLMTALSGIDQALWDIAGKHYGVPTHQLLGGGAVRDQIRVYAHWGIGSLTDEGKARSKERLEMLQKKGGYKAFKSGPGGKWQAVAYIQPDTSHVGGITELKKIANMAEVYYIHIMPHCAIGPVAFSASLQVDAVVPNFLIQEQVDSGLGAGLLQEEWEVKDGHIELPTKPGLGFEIDEKEAEQDCGIYEEELGGEFYYESDGSVADW